MKKTILASAIAAATFSGAAMAQSTLSASELAAKMDSMPTVYGNIQYAITHTNVDGGGSEVKHFDNGTTLGVKHDHEVAPGITGFFKLELEGINADDKSGSNGIDGLDEAYIGIKGDSFGQVWVGSDDSMYESAIDEIYNFHEVGSDIQGNYDTGEGDLIQYLSPSFSGLTFGAAVQFNGDNDAKDGDKSFPYQLAAMYEVDALELAFAIDSNDNGNGNNENTYGLRASYNLDNLRLTGSYETRKDVADIFGVMGVYTMGKNQFALSYQLEDNDESGDKNDTIILQALHNLSDHMYVYVEGYLSNADEEVYSVENEPGTGDEQSIAAIGAVYYF
ncbi:porin [Marinobacter nauticus]|uniref:Outer membrane protein (Porin) n=1 Tax=Marinobacter nauticus (strain ATCC 700491 / DSM 11845 / VT8) TaxID=351348 RepID=A1TYQ1_MARN8|nr:porin [Marinobacter nauticus]ABM17870.1 outer membrane protein (porin) [Marinobacter nauticus VT8]